MCDMKWREPLGRKEEEVGMRYIFIKFCPAALQYTFHLGEGQGENGGTGRFCG